MATPLASRMVAAGAEIWRARSDLYCMGSSGQVSVGYTELAAMDVCEDGHIDSVGPIMPDTCPGRHPGWSSRRPRCCGGRCVIPSASREGAFGKPGSDPLPNSAVYEIKRRVMPPIDLPDSFDHALQCRM